MSDKLTVQDALTELLKENIDLLKNGSVLTKALFERTDISFVDRAFYEKAFVDANIGEIFAVLDSYNKKSLVKAKKEAIEKTSRYVRADRVESIVASLLEAIKEATKEERKRKINEKLQKRAERIRKKEEQIKREQEEIKIQEELRKEQEQRKKEEREKARQERKRREKEEQEKALKENERKKKELQEKKRKDNERKKREQEEQQEQLKKQNQELAREHNNKGDEYFDKDDYDNALTEYNTAIRLDPDYAEAYYKCGLAYRKKGLLNEAITSFSQCIDMGFNLTETYYCRGTLHYALGKRDKALIDYTKAIDYAPEDPRSVKLYEQRAKLYVFYREYDKAVADYKKTIELNPRYDVAKTELIWLCQHYADSYNQKGEYNKAIEEYNKIIAFFHKAVALIPINDVNKYYLCELYEYRAKLYSEYEEYSKAIADYTKAIDYRPDDYSLYNNRGAAYQNMGDYDKAFLDYQKAVELDPNNNLAKENLQNIKDYLEQEKQSDGEKLELEDALVELLKDRDILKNGQCLIDKLENLTSVSTVEQAFYRAAFIKVNIGEMFLNEDLETAKVKALINLNQVMSKQHAKYIVEALANALERTAPPPPKPKEGLFKKFFSTRGRLNRIDFFLREIAIVTLTILSISFSIYYTKTNGFIGVVGGCILLLILIFAFISYTSLITRRMQDFNLFGLWILPIYFSYVIILVVEEEYRSKYDDPWITISIILLSLVYLHFKGGTNGPNKYGVVKSVEKGKGLLSDFFSCKGRLNRIDFVLRELVAIVALVIGCLVMPPYYYFQSDRNILSNLGLGIMLVALVSLTGLIIRRLHDMNRAGWWAIPLVIIYFFTVLNLTGKIFEISMEVPEPLFYIFIILSRLLVYLIFIILSPYLHLKKGTTGSNQYGEQEEEKFFKK
ncbi:MAG: tetratricopeptide repeat protein [Selenomonadaceae bacterium]|nr:tetratricopeptide repeat protein [Selenomonadaceae bacterium]